MFEVDVKIVLLKKIKTDSLFLCPFLEQIVHCVHTNLETQGVLYTKLHVIIIDVSHCLASVFVLISNHNAPNVLRERAAAPSR